jgi:hypothetical protein
MNTHGRPIMTGPRGGRFVVDTTTGRKIYKFKEAVAPAPAPTPRPVVYANRGGRFVVDTTTGRKIYNFKEAVAPAPTPRPVVNTNLTMYKKRVNAGKTMAARKLVYANAKRSALPSLKELKVYIDAKNEAARKARAEQKAAVKKWMNNFIGRGRAVTPNFKNRARAALARVRERLKYPSNFSQVKRPTAFKVPINRYNASVPRKATPQKEHINLGTYNSGTFGKKVQNGIVLGTRQSNFDMSWFEAQNRYIKSLNDDDFWTLMSYTNRSHSWIGPYIRSNKRTVPHFTGTSTTGTHIIPMFSQFRKFVETKAWPGKNISPWVETFKTQNKQEKQQYTTYRRQIGYIPAVVRRWMLDQYQQDLHRIIKAAPVNTKRMVLYRGNSTNIFQGTFGKWFKNKGFISTAFELSHAMGYAGQDLTRITVLPGTHMILVAGLNQWNPKGEYEIILNDDTRYLIRKRDIYKWVVKDWGNPVKKRVTEVVIT